MIPVVAHVLAGKFGAWDVAKTVNGLLGVAYPVLEARVRNESKIWVPSHAEGSLIAGSEDNFDTGEDSLRQSPYIFLMDEPGDQPFSMIGFGQIRLKKAAFRFGHSHLSVVRDGEPSETPFTITLIYTPSDPEWKWLRREMGRASLVTEDRVGTPQELDLLHTEIPT